jgi:hypothetical protein
VFVTSIEYGSPNADISTLSPTWDAVEKHLRSLDGDSKDGVILSTSGNSYLGISGGRRNQYIVAGYIEGHGSVILAGGENDGKNQEVVVAGDFQVFASEFVVGLDVAVCAAKTFFDCGTLAPELKWKPQT